MYLLKTWHLYSHYLEFPLLLWFKRKSVFQSLFQLCYTFFRSYLFHLASTQLCCPTTPFFSTIGQSHIQRQQAFPLSFTLLQVKKNLKALTHNKALHDYKITIHSLVETACSNSEMAADPARKAIVIRAGFWFD
jgi:hypothetical protein